MKKKKKRSFFFVHPSAAPPLRFQIFFEFCCGGFFFHPVPVFLSRNSDFKIGGSAVFVPKNFSALLTRDIGNIGNCIFFAEQKKSNKWRRRRKKFRGRCKNLAFYSTELHIESFFAKQKRKNGAAGKKKLRYSLDGAVSNPVPHGTPVVQPRDFFFFFFFFSDFCCAATELYTVAEPLPQCAPPPHRPHRGYTLGLGFK